METLIVFDSFSQLHSYSYSLIALQELNLNYFYPRVYWNCACLTVEAMGLKDNEDGSDKSKATDYGEIAKAIYKMRQSNINVHAPSINDSDIEFTPREADDTILFGLAGIASINPSISAQIINNRPYTSFQDFYTRNTYQGSLVTPSKFVMLIKAGCFDEFNPDRMAVMQEYFELSTDEPISLTMANLPEIMRLNISVPANLRKPYNFYKYVINKRFLIGQHPNFKSKRLYWLDDKAKTYFEAHCTALTEGVDWWVDENIDKTIVVDKSLEKLFKGVFTKLKEYINTPKFLHSVWQAKVQSTMQAKVPNMDVNHWSLEATSFYSQDHELACVNRERYNISLFDKLPVEPRFVTKRTKDREYKIYALAQIAGVVLARNDAHHTVTILDINNNVVQCKFATNDFAKYKAQISEQHGDNKQVMDKSWLARGTVLVLTGVRVGENDFRIKTYKNSIYDKKVRKIVKVNTDGTMKVQSNRYGEQEEYNAST